MLYRRCISLQFDDDDAIFFGSTYQDKIDPAIMRESLESMNNEGTDIPLTVRSLK